MAAVPLPQAPLHPNDTASTPSPGTEVRADATAALNRVEALAHDLRRRHWDQLSLPLSAQELAEGAGVEVRNRGGPEEPLYPHRGRLLYLDDRAVIELNQAEAPADRRIVLAHALGHHLLGHGPVPPEVGSHLSIHCARLMEQEAHRFALDLLMPDFAIHRLMNQGVVSVVRLAQKFFVPESAMRERLQTLERDRAPL